MSFSPFTYEKMGAYRAPFHKELQLTRTIDISRNATLVMYVLSIFADLS